MIARIKNKIMRIKADIKVGLGLYKKSNSPIILSYHGIAHELATSLNSRHIDLKTFEDQLIFIKKHCNPVSLLKLNNIADIKGKRKVVLTFDDGYYNNLKFALPLLEKYEVPASIYITGLNQTQHSVLWSDYHDIIAQFGPKSFSLNNKTYTHNGSDYKPFVDTDGDNLHNALKMVDFDKKYQILNEIIPWEELRIKANREDYWKLLSDSEIKEINQSHFIEIGSHSFFHNNLSNIEPNEAFKEVSDSKVYLESLLQNPLYSIAYPDGSYTREIVEYSSQLGFKKQLAVNYNYTADIDDNRILSRIGVYEYETLSMQKINIMEK